jgi:hypothetical protein
MRSTLPRTESFHSTFSSLGSVSVETPPSYVSQSTAPCYSAEPGSGERRLVLNPRVGHQGPRTGIGVFVKETKTVRVELRDQEPSATQPAYGLNATIAGEVYLSKPGSVVDVTAKVR